MRENINLFCFAHQRLCVCVSVCCEQGQEHDKIGNNEGKAIQSIFNQISICSSGHYWFNNGR